jgi:hypothetical protein
MWRIDLPATGPRIILDTPRLTRFRGDGRNGGEWIRELERDRATLRRSVARLEERMDAMQASTSWRVTAPLRSAMGGWRRLWGREP